MTKTKKIFGTEYKFKVTIAFPFLKLSEKYGGNFAYTRYNFIKKHEYATYRIYNKSSSRDENTTTPPDN